MGRKFDNHKIPGSKTGCPKNKLELSEDGICPQIAI